MVVNDALVQQVGSPLTVYDRPVNRFVAGFLGTPPMNLLDGKIVQDNGHMYFDEGSGRVRLPGEWSDHLAPYRDKDMVLGVRPENLSPRSEGAFAGEENSLNVHVEVVEPLGDKIDVYVSTPRHDHIVCRIDARTRLHEDDNVAMYTDVTRLHVFEPGDSGRNISLKG